MIGAALALALTAGAPSAAPGDLSRRVGQSAVAAQELQGPLDGAWTLRDTHGRRLYELQITDPPGGAGPIDGAWRDGADTAQAGPLQSIARRGDRLTIRFAAADLVLRWRDRTLWTGRLREAGRVIDVSLRPPRPAMARRGAPAHSPFPE